MASLPESIEAMLQARLQELGAADRRLLRAASVLGETFWTGAVVALLDDGGAPDAALGRLIDDELVDRRRESRLAGQEELAFRHALLREAAYATLTTADRVEQHRRAAVWLESAGEHDPAVLAEHWERAGVNDRAAACLLDAARRAYRGSDAARAVTFAERALALVPGSSSLSSKLQVLRAASHGWLGQMDRAREAGLAAIRLSRPGSRDWYQAVANVMSPLTTIGEPAGLDDLVDQVLALPPEPATAAARFLALNRIAQDLPWVGRTGQARAMLSHVEAMARVSGDPLARAYTLLLRGILGSFHVEDPWQTRSLLTRAARDLESLGAIQAGQLARIWAALLSIYLGRCLEVLDIVDVGDGNCPCSRAACSICGATPCCGSSATTRRGVTGCGLLRR
jgi:hypothetical protein